MAKCPSHDDRQASLSIRVGKDERVVMFCHASCDVKAIVAALGLTMADLFVEARPSLTVASSAHGVNSRQRAVKSYDYHDASGEVLFQVCRMEQPKAFPQRRPMPDGSWKWGLGDVQPVLYRLPETLEAVAHGRRIFVVEGEKDVETLVELGYPATTSPMGAGKWRDEYAETLAGADVVILPDNDEKGHAHAEDAAASLLARGCKVRVIDLPNLPPKGDITDWFEAGHSVDELEALIGRAHHRSADPSQAQRRTRWRMDELLERDDIMRPPPPVVPYLAWGSRSTLLAAREKSGKSTLTGFITAQITNGGMFLDEPCQPGVVLIIGLEEFIGDTVRRLRDFGADPSKVEIVEALITGNRLAELRAHVDAVSPVLVIVDSLIAYSAGTITDANSAAQTQVIVQGLTNLAHETGTALIIIHHAKKADGKYRDSSAIGGAVDIIAEVFPPDENADPNRRRVRPVGRVPARAVDFRFDGDRYTRVDAQAMTKAPVEQRILDIVRERPGVAANDIANEVQESRKLVLDRIRFMVHQGLLLNDGTASHYRLRLPTYPPPTSML
jgi:putative DNA primase/helicase